MRLRLIRRRPAAVDEAGRPGTWAFLRDAPRLLPYVRPRKGLAVASLALVGAGAGLSLLSPWPLAILIDTVLGHKPLPALLKPIDGLGRYTLLAIAVGGGLALTALENGLAVLSEYVNTKLDQTMVLDLRSDMFKHVHRLTQSFMDVKRTGQLMFEINNQASAAGAITVSIPPLIQAVVTLVGMFAVMYSIDPLLAGLSLAVVPFIYLTAGYYARQIQPQVIRVRNLESRSMTIVHEAVSMLRVIVAFAREDHEYGRFRAQGEDAVNSRVRLTVRQTAFSLVVTTLTATGSALVLGFGAFAVLHHRMTAGDLLVVMGYVTSMYQPLQQISNTVSSLQEQFLTLRGALRLLDTEPEVKERPYARTLWETSGRITFEHVYFRYPGRRGTLKDVSFDAPGGSCVALVGPTGAGKSTILSLISRFHDPRDGRVLIDGTDLRELKLASLRSHISVVHQEPLLFSMSLRDNIRYGRLDATDEEVERAAMAAGAHDFIAALPQEYDTEIGERGARMSGGERQRIAVARAFLKNAPILILDEPTSSVDSRTEGVILTALDRLMEGRTTFIVAHRLSTIESCDLILVVNDGRIVEQGTEAQLLAAGSLFAELHAAQSGARRRRATAGVSADGLSDLTRAVVARHDRGAELSGTALSELARAMATDGQDPAWRLVAAARPLFEHGDPGPLRTLAADHTNTAAKSARRLLVDLGVSDIPPLPSPAAVHAEAAA
jgi:ABC-type multidrug transport system fused ATPase/permease subunit